MSDGTAVSAAVAKDGDAILDAWVSAQEGTRTYKFMTKEELRSQCREILNDLRNLPSYDMNSPVAVRMRDRLVETSRKRGLQGFSPVETATFVFSLKDVLFPFLKEQLKGKPAKAAEETVDFNRLIDQLGLDTFSAYVESREAYVREQQKSILELSTPVVQVWEGILALPIIGAVVDTARTQQMMESVLTRIVETGSSVVIIDITGVPVVDTAVAKHLLQTVSAARLLGAECLLVGISARIAQTLVHLGVDLSTVTTGTTLAQGLQRALTMTGRKIVKAE